ncbi:hypothetical protein M3J07_013460 [Ascochyta lentis]
MTWAACASYCTGYQYTGITAGSVCRCGSSFAFSPSPNLDILCQTPCTGNSLQTCGASNRSTVFRNSNYGGISPISPVASVISPLAVLPSSSVNSQASPIMALMALPTTRASTLITLASVLSSSSAAQTALATQVAPVSPASVYSGAALPLIPVSLVPAAAPVSALTMIGAPLSVTAVPSTSSAEPLPPSTLVGPALNWAAPSSSATTSGQPSAFTMIGAPLAFAAPALLESASEGLSKVQTMVSSLAPILSLPAFASTQASIPVATVSPSQPMGLSQLPSSSVPLPVFPLSTTSAAVLSLVVPAATPSIILQPTTTSQAPLTPIVPFATLLPVLAPPSIAIQQVPSLIEPALSPVLSSLVPLFALPTSLVPSLATTLTTIASIQPLGVWLSNTLPTQIPNIQLPPTNLNSEVPTAASTGAPIPLIGLPPVIPVISPTFLLPVSPGTGTGGLAVPPVATPIDEPFQIFGLFGEPAAANPVIAPSLAAILPPVGSAPVFLSKTSSPLPSVVLGLLPTSASLVPSPPATTLNVPPLGLPPLAVSTETETPWWVVTQFLEPHGLPGPTILAPPPPLPTLQPASPIDEPEGTFGAFSFDEPTEIEPSSNFNAASIEPILPTVIDSGKVIDKVFTWTFYSTGLVKVDNNFLSPSAGPLQGFLPDGTRIGLDSDGLYIGWEHRVPYPSEYLPTIAGVSLPPPQLFL